MGQLLVFSESHKHKGNCITVYHRNAVQFMRLKRQQSFLSHEAKTTAPLQILKELTGKIQCCYGSKSIKIQVANW